MSGFAVLFPAGMIVAPLVFVGLWCAWTGVRGLLRLAFATLGALLVFAAGWLLAGPIVAMRPGFAQAWGLGAFFVLLFAFGLPHIRRAFAALPAPPRAASLAPRRLELFRGALAWPFIAWAVLAAMVLRAHADRPLIWLGPAAGLAELVLLALLLPRTVHEPEPLGGPDPAGLARRYAAFRRRRVWAMYILMVALGLGVTGLGLPLGPLPAGWTGGLFGTLLGLSGAVFGTWADAQRYLLRRQAAGLEPPGH